MKITYDPDKDAANIAKHGLSLAEFRGFDIDPSIYVDDRHDYGETRLLARGRIGGRGYCVVFTVSNAVARVISFRRAHEKEMRRYE